MSNLFDLTGEMGTLMEIFDRADEENLSPEEQENLLEIMAETEEELREKLISYAKIDIQFEADLVAIEDEINRLKQNKERRKAQIKKLKKAMEFAMGSSGISKVDDPIVKIQRRKKPVTVEVAEEDKIPEQFRKAKLEFEAGELDLETRWDLEAKYGNKLLIKEEISKSKLSEWFKKTGEVIAGTNIRDNEYSIIIK